MVNMKPNSIRDQINRDVWLVQSATVFLKINRQIDLQVSLEVQHKAGSQILFVMEHIEDSVQDNIQAYLPNLTSFYEARPLYLRVF